MRKPLKICYLGMGDSIHTQVLMRWYVDNGHEVNLITDRLSRMPRITEYQLGPEGTYTGSRFNRYIRLEFNQHHLRLLSKKLKIDLIRQIFRVKQMIKKINPDIIHLHSLFYPAFLGVFIKGYPLVVTLWNGDIVWKYKWSVIRKYAVRRGLAKANLITVDSDELRQKAMRYGKYQNKTELIYMGVDTNKFQPNNKVPELRKQLGISLNAPVAISNRSFNDIYNIDIIISAIPMVLKEIPSTVFLFTWHASSDKEYLYKLAERMGITKNVRFLGNLKHSELPKYYKEADIAISIPSYDTIPVSLLEAMASGCAPVISDLASPREIIKDGINGYVVPVRDIEATAQAIIKLLEDEDLRQSFSEKNLRWVIKNADWDKNMKKVGKLYYLM